MICKQTLVNTPDVRYQRTNGAEHLLGEVHGRSERGREGEQLRLLTGRCTTSARPLLRGTCFVARRQGDDRRGDSLDPSKFGLELPDLFNGPGRFTGPQS
jgi:hypothetical protein